MKVRFLSPYERSLTSSSRETRLLIDKAIGQLLKYFETGQRPHGLGLKRLRGPYWEIRAGLALRVYFHLAQDTLTFILVGTHTDIRRLLKRL